MRMLIGRPCHRCWVHARHAARRAGALLTMRSSADIRPHDQMRAARPSPAGLARVGGGEAPQPPAAHLAFLSGVHVSALHDREHDIERRANRAGRGPQRC